MNGDLQAMRDRLEGIRTRRAAIQAGNCPPAGASSAAREAYSRACDEFFAYSAGSVEFLLDQVADRDARVDTLIRERDQNAAEWQRSENELAMEQYLHQKAVRERDKWIAKFNASEQFQDGPTKRAEFAEAQLSAALQREQEIKALADELATPIDDWSVKRPPVWLHEIAARLYAILSPPAAKEPSA